MPFLRDSQNRLVRRDGTVVKHAAARRLPTEHLTRLGLPDRLIGPATRKEQLAEVGLDPLGSRAACATPERVVERMLSCGRSLAPTGAVFAAAWDPGSTAVLRG